MLRATCLALFLCAASIRCLAQTPWMDREAALNQSARYVMFQHTGTETASLPVYYIVEKTQDTPRYDVPGVEVETLSRRGLDSAMTRMAGWLVTSAAYKGCRCAYNGKFGSFKIVLKQGGAPKERHLDCRACSTHFLSQVISATAARDTEQTRILNTIATKYLFYLNAHRRK